MNYSEYRLSVDMHGDVAPHSIRVKKGDSHRKILFNLNDDGKTYYITDGCVAKLRYKRPEDDNATEITCTISDNVIECVLTSTVTAKVGITKCELVLSSSNTSSATRITSPTFNLIVDDTVE